MFVVHFMDNKDVLLTQFLKRVPSVGEDVKIKKRKGKVLSVIDVDEKIVQVQVILEEIKKINFTMDKKKRR